MNRCEYCNVSVDGALTTCPLCGRTVARGEKERKQAQSYPAYSMESREEEPKKRPVYKATAVTAGVVGVCAWINLATRGVNGGFWCLDIAVIFGYIWLLVLNTVRSKIRGSVKLMLQAGIISLMLCVFDWNAGRGLWSVNYAIPIACIGLNFLVTYIVFTRKLSWREYIGYMIAVLIFGQTPFIGVLTGVTLVVWPSFTAGAYAIVTFVMMLICADGNYKESRAKRFRF